MMHLSINIIGDAFADIYCYLGASNMPEHGGDARLEQPMHTVAGGSGLNTATHLSSLLRHFWMNNESKDDSPRTCDVNLQTVINETDEYGKLIASHSRSHQFNLINRRVSNFPSCYLGTNEAAMMQRQEGVKSTGHCAVIVSKGDRSFMTHLGCMEDFRGSHVLTNFLGQNDGNSTPTHQHVHIAGYYNIEGFWNGELASKLAEMRKIQTKTAQRLTISLVPQHDATDAWDGGLLRILQYIDFLVLNEVETKNVTKFQCGDTADDGDDDTSDTNFFRHASEFFSKYTKTCIIVTRGSKGASALCEGEIIHDQRTSPEIDNPTDPTGAGDAFAAGFLHGYLSYQAKSKSKVDCEITKEAVKAGMQWACAVGTCSVMVQGASVPSKKEGIEQILSNIVEHETKAAKRCRVE